MWLHLFIVVDTSLLVDQIFCSFVDTFETGFSFAPFVLYIQGSRTATTKRRGNPTVAETELMVVWIEEAIMHQLKAENSVKRCREVFVSGDFQNNVNRCGGTF